MKILVILFAMFMLVSLVSLGAANNGNEFAGEAASYFVPITIALGMAMFLTRIAKSMRKSHDD